MTLFQMTLTLRVIILNEFDIKAKGFSTGMKKTLYFATFPFCDLIILFYSFFILCNF
jgi:hypothetical protein